MGMDRNTVIGFALIGVLMMGMFYFNSKGNQAYMAEQKRIEDSLNALRPKVDSTKILKETAAADSIHKIQAAGGFQQSIAQAETLSTVENEVIKVVFSNKGAQPVSVTLKKYQTPKLQLQTP